MLLSCKTSPHQSSLRSKPRLRIAVQDSGQPLRADEREALLTTELRSKDFLDSSKLGGRLGLIIARQLVRLMAGAEFPGWWMFFGCFVAALLWIPLHYVLLLPQYQPVSRDENRPI